MKAVDGDRGRASRSARTKPAVYLRELALPYARRTVVVLEHDIVEVDGVLADGGDVDDARAGEARSRGSSRRERSNPAR